MEVCIDYVQFHNISCALAPKKQTMKPWHPVESYGCLRVSTETVFVIVSILVARMIKVWCG